VELRLLRIRENPLIFFSLGGDPSSIALREVVPVRRRQSPGEIDGGDELESSVGDEKDDLRKRDVLGFGIGIGVGAERGANWGARTPGEPGLYAGGGSRNDESKRGVTLDPPRDCADSDE